LCQKNRALRHGLDDRLNCIWWDHSTIFQQNQKERIKARRRTGWLVRSIDVSTRKACGASYFINEALNAVPTQSPSPGASEKYFANFPSSPSRSFASGKGSRRSVRFGHSAENFRLSSSQLSRPLSVSGLMASAGHSGSHTPQSMHSS